jgi:nickel-dependent lactate racemase
MVRFDLAYGRDSVAVDVPERNLIGTLDARPMVGVDLPHAFDEAWRNPFGIQDPAALFRRGESVVVVVTDHTRKTPTRLVFPLVWDRIKDRAALDDVTLLVATGTHRPSTDAELEKMLGDLRRQFRVAIHDCDKDTVEVGRSQRGTPILVNRIVAEADHVITLGHVGMHYYAGYSGGRKNILPGVAGRATIEANHAQLSNPKSEACVYDGNPISEEMVEAAKLVGVDFIVDVVLNAKGEVAKVVVGEPEAAHAEARRFWDAHAIVSVPERADLVIASAGGHPKDIDLYQAYKAQYTAARAVLDGGMIYLLAACPDGIGHRVFQDWIERSAHPADVLCLLEQEGFKLGGHKAVYHAQDLARVDVFLQSELPSETVCRFFYKAVDRPAAVLEEARRRFGPTYRTLVMPHAGETFPVANGSG